MNMRAPGVLLNIGTQAPRILHIQSASVSEFRFEYHETGKLYLVRVTGEPPYHAELLEDRVENGTIARRIAGAFLAGWREAKMIKIGEPKEIIGAAKVKGEG